MIDPAAVGAVGEPFERSWTSKDCLLYALGVGAGVDELPFTTENSAGVEQRVLPTFAVIVARGGGELMRRVGDIDMTMVVHGEQSIVLHRELPVEGTARNVNRIAAVYDKGSGAVIVTETTSVDAATGEPLFDAVSSTFVRGAGGFGGERGPSSAFAPPDRAPDHVVTYATRADQALLYRLSGDRNPLHSDPSFAAAAGFPRPILHGLCTYGFAGRALLHAVCGSDPARLRSMSGRFSKPVFPGDAITVSVWDDGLFQASVDGAVVIDAGRFELAH